MRAAPRIYRRAAGVLLVALALAAGLTPGFAAKKSQEQEITDNIICPCSCGEVLTGCTCDTGKEMKAFVETSLRSGKNGEDITHALVAQYGEVVLGAPRAKGFNLIVWVAPFLVTLVGFAVAFFLLRRWAGRGAAAEVPAAPEPGRSAEQDMDALRARAEDELRRLRG